MALRLVEVHRLLKPSGGLWLHCDFHASHHLRMLLELIFGRANFRNEIAWCYPSGGLGPRFSFPQRHDVLLWFAKTNKHPFNKPYLPFTAKQRAAFTGNDPLKGKFKRYPHGTTYLNDLPGAPVTSWWSDIQPLGVKVNAAERTGYPTEKPIELVKRIIEASSNRGDLIMDPFCGSGAALIAAEAAGREWIGMDINKQAVEAVDEKRRRVVGGLLQEDMSYD